MLYAIDINGDRFSAENAKKGNSFYCEMCGEQVVLRQGNERVDHFAHKSASECTDTWSKDMSDWHRNWQKKFPEECREIVKELDGVKHRADILIEKTKTVIEFQHSPLSNDEFLERNRFYNELEYKVVWVFDFTEDFDYKKFHRVGTKKDMYKYEWINPRNTFEGFDVKQNKSKIEIYFQIKLDTKDNEKLIECKKEIEVWDHLCEEYNYYENHKNDKVTLWKIVWNEEGFFSFICSEKQYFEYDILALQMVYTKKETVKGCTVFELWENGNYRKAVFKNMETGGYIKITENPFVQRKKSGKVYGYISNDTYNFSGNSRELYYLSSPIWVLNWGE